MDPTPRDGAVVGRIGGLEDGEHLLRPGGSEEHRILGLVHHCLLSLSVTCNSSTILNTATSLAYERRA